MAILDRPGSISFIENYSKGVRYMIFFGPPCHAFVAQKKISHFKAQFSKYAKGAKKLLLESIKQANDALEAQPKLPGFHEENCATQKCSPITITNHNSV